MAAEDISAANTGWQSLGVRFFSQSAAAPKVELLSPTRGTAPRQMYTFTTSHPNGFANLNVLNVLINRSLDSEIEFRYRVFLHSFGGDRINFAAANDLAGRNSNWQAMGTLNAQ